MGPDIQSTRKNRIKATIPTKNILKENSPIKARKCIISLADKLVKNIGMIFLKEQSLSVDIISLNFFSNQLMSIGLSKVANPTYMGYLKTNNLFLSVNNRLSLLFPSGLELKLLKDMCFQMLSITILYPFM